MNQTDNAWLAAHGNINEQTRENFVTGLLYDHELNVDIEDNSDTDPWDAFHDMAVNGNESDQEMLKSIGYFDSDYYLYGEKIQFYGIDFVTKNADIGKNNKISSENISIIVKKGKQKEGKQSNRSWSYPQGQESIDQILKTYLPAGSLRESIPLFYLSYFVPAPTQDFNIVFFCPHDEKLHNLIGGLIVIGHDDGFGVTVELYEESSNNNCSRFRGIARQTVEILNKSERVYYDNTRVHNGRVYHTEDDIAFYIADVLILSDFTGDSMASLRSVVQSQSLSIVSSLTSFPPVLLNNINGSGLMSSIHSRLSIMLRDYDTIEFPTSLVQFSYYLLKFLPLSKGTKAYLIQLPTTLERLQYLHAIVSTPFGICCRECGFSLFEFNDIIPTKHNSYPFSYNPEFDEYSELFGVIPTETIITRKKFRSDFKGLPGYKYSPAVCRECQIQVGYAFIAKNTNLLPTKFTVMIVRTVKIKFRISVNANSFIDILNKTDNVLLHNNECLWRHSNFEDRYG